MTDTELMLRMRRGDEQAFAHLIGRFQNMLINYFHRNSFDRDDAADQAQEVFLKVWRARRSYEPRAKVSTYLLRIARNHCIDVVRSRRIRPGEVALEAASTAGSSGERSGSLADVLDSGALPPDLETIRSELRRELEQAVEQLPVAHREVWVLAELKGVRYADIAEILDIPVGTVKSRHHHAVAKLREILLGRPGMAAAVEEM